MPIESMTPSNHLIYPLKIKAEREEKRQIFHRLWLQISSDYFVKAWVLKRSPFISLLVGLVPFLKGQGNIYCKLISQPTARKKKKKWGGQAEFMLNWLNFRSQSNIIDALLKNLISEAAGCWTRLLLLQSGFSRVVLMFTLQLFAHATELWRISIDVRYFTGSQVYFKKFATKDLYFSL